MKWDVFVPYVLVMAAVTYLTRMVPLVLVRRKIKSRFFRSFLYYVPYAVLSAMTFPAIFASTGNLYASILGSMVALALGWMKQSLIVVAVAACAASFVGLLIFR